MAGRRTVIARLRAVDEFPFIASDLLKQLDAIEPSVNPLTTGAPIKHWPAAVEMNDGQIHERVLFMEADPYLNHWGVAARDTEENKEFELSLTDVKRLWESPHRLPAEFASRIYSFGECGMGLVIFTALLKDGDRITVATGNLVDFTPLPFGFSVDKIMHVVDEGTREDAQGIPANYAVKMCPFRFPEPD